MVEKGVAWCPTFAIYEANKDLIRAMNQPWFKEARYPALEEYFKPNPASQTQLAMVFIFGTRQQRMKFSSK